MCVDACGCICVCMCIHMHECMHVCHCEVVEGGHTKGSFPMFKLREVTPRGHSPCSS